MDHEVFADGIGEITVTGSTVRIDLVSLSPTDRDDAGQPRPVFRQRIVMPIEGLANAADLIRRVVDDLVEARAIQRAPVQSAAAPLQSEPAPRRAASPNFN